MHASTVSLGDGTRRVVGSIGDAGGLARTSVAEAAAVCDLVEIRLDALAAECGFVDSAAWAHLRGLPLLFTARRADEGGIGDAGDDRRAAWIEAALDDAACVDIEVASIPAMSALLARLDGRGVPWIASFHDFSAMPADEVLESAVRRALDAGAAAFKVAVRLSEPAELARLAGFQLAGHGLPVASMGMGPLAAVSRLLCAQCGSVLNYGFLSGTATAPGQWDAGLLRLVLSRVEPFGGAS